MQVFNFKNIYSLNITFGVFFLITAMLIYQSSKNIFSIILSVFILIIGLHIIRVSIRDWTRRENSELEKLDLEKDLLKKDKEKRDVEIANLKTNQELMLNELADKSNEELGSYYQGKMREHTKKSIREELESKKCECSFNRQGTGDKKDGNRC